MGLKLAHNSLGNTDEKGSKDFQIKRLIHPSEILPYLEKERIYSVSGIAHLEPELMDSSKWLLATSRDSLSLCLICKGTSPNYMLTIGSPAVLDCLLESQSLPGRSLITCKPQHFDIVKNHFEITWHRLVRRMVSTRETFTPTKEEAIRLRPHHVRELNELYAHHTRHRFSPHQIRQGIYYGIWRDGKLVAVAGTHLISQRYGIACVGNVLTHAAYRNQGLATFCTSAVTERLLDFCTEVVLDVEPHNVPAVRAYASLGYCESCDVIEALGRRRSFVDDIIVKLCKQARDEIQGKDGNIWQRLKTMI